MIKSAAAVLLTLISFELSAQNVLQQTNNIVSDYYQSYETTMNSVLGTLQNGSPASMKALAKLSNNQLSISYLEKQSKKFRAYYKVLQNGGRPSLHPKKEGKDKWWVYTYFIINDNSSISYFLQIKVVFAQSNLVPLSRMKIGDVVQEAKIKYLEVLDSRELIPPKLSDVYEALKESDELMGKASTPEFQKLMKEILDKERKKK